MAINGSVPGDQAKAAVRWMSRILAMLRGRIGALLPLNLEKGGGRTLSEEERMCRRVEGSAEVSCIVRKVERIDGIDE